jgi:hypothetical protein
VHGLEARVVTGAEAVSRVDGCPPHGCDQLGGVNRRQQGIVGNGRRYEFDVLAIQYPESAGEPDGQVEPKSYSVSESSQTTCTDSDTNPTLTATSRSPAAALADYSTSIRISADRARVW